MLRLGPAKLARRFGPSGGRVKPSGAEQGWACIAPKTRFWGVWGQFGPSGAEEGRLGLRGVGEGLGMHWGSSITLRLGPVYKDRPSGRVWAG